MRLQYRKTGDTKLSRKPQKLRSAAYRREDGQILFEKNFYFACAREHPAVAKREEYGTNTTERPGTVH